MKLMAILLITFFLAGCASTFETFESQKKTCHDQGKKLAYNTQTFEGYGCVTESEIATLKANLAATPQPRTSPSQDMAAGMILQGFALRGGPLGSLQMPAPYVPYTPPAFIPAPVPRSLPPVSCSTNIVGGYAHTDCY